MAQISSKLHEFHHKLRDLKVHCEALGTYRDVPSFRKKLISQREDVQKLSMEIANDFKQYKPKRYEKQIYEKNFGQFKQLLYTLEEINAFNLEREKEITTLIESALNDEGFRTSG